MNTARHVATATLLHGELLIAGGFNSSKSYLPGTERCDLATDSFVPMSETPNMNAARFEATATLLPNGKVLIAGGSNSSSEQSC
jgi:hypothetical protein